MIQKKYKTFWRRLTAGLIDGLLFTPFSYIDKWIWNSSDTVSSVVLSGWFILYSLSYVGYSILMHGFYGQTIGKMLAGVKVLDVSENKLTMRQAVLRDCVPLVLIVFDLIVDLPNVFHKVNPYTKKTLHEMLEIHTVTVLSSLLWFMAEVITMLTNKKRRAIHDIIAGSVVLNIGRSRRMVKRDMLPLWEGEEKG